MEQFGPFFVFTEVSSLTYDNQSVLRPSDCHINAIVLLNEVTRFGPYHGDKHDIKLTSLRAVNRYDLLSHILSDKLVDNGVLLCIVGRNNKDVTPSEPNFRNARSFLVYLGDFFKLACTHVCHFTYDLDLLKIDKRCPFQSFNSILHVNEKEWTLGVQKYFLDVANITTVDLVVIE